MVSTAISATIGVASLSLGDSLPDDAVSAWRVWWLGDTGGDLIVAPLLFVAITGWPFRGLPGRPLEAVPLLAGLVAVAIVAFSESAPLAYLTFPFMIWAALRFLQPGTTVAALTLATIARGLYGQRLGSVRGLLGAGARLAGQLAGLPVA